VLVGLSMAAIDLNWLPVCCDVEGWLSLCEALDVAMLLREEGGISKMRGGAVYIKPLRRCEVKRERLL
jgi:hypothetical protein